MVTDRAEGTKRKYRLNEHGVAALRDQLDTFWRRTLEGFEQQMGLPMDPQAGEHTDQKEEG